MLVSKYIEVNASVSLVIWVTTKDWPPTGTCNMTLTACIPQAVRVHNKFETITGPRNTPLSRTESL